MSEPLFTVDTTNGFDLMFVQAACDTIMRGTYSILDVWIASAFARDYRDRRESPIGRPSGAPAVDVMFIIREYDVAGADMHKVTAAY